MLDVMKYYKHLVESMEEKEEKIERRVPKGYVPVIVGVEDECSEKFLMQVEFLRDPRITGLLDMAAGEFGYRQQGVLRIPCDAEYFRQVVALVAKHR